MNTHTVGKLQVGYSNAIIPIAIPLSRNQLEQSSDGLVTVCRDAELVSRISTVDIDVMSSKDSGEDLK